MKSKIHFFLMMAIMAICSQVFAQRPSFNKNKDILIACFDIKPDPDDIHAVAALGSMLAHPDLTGVEYFAVAGAYGSQGGSYLQSNSLFNMAFGNNWTDAHSNRSAAIAAITSKVVPILQNGGKVWVQEGGQSDVTADWLMPVINASNGINSNTTKNNVILVQHDDGFNEGQANQSKLNNVKANTRYFLLDDGNAGWNDGWGDHGPWSTPMYRNRSNSFVDQAKNSPNSVAKTLWTEADRIFNNYFPNGFPHDWSFFFTDGVDYSDCVENWWIFEIGSNADTHDKFWSRYVMNTTSNPGPDPTPCTGKTFEEKNGVAAIEAEDFVKQSKTKDREWFIIGSGGNGSTPNPDPDPGHQVAASGGKYVELLPDTRVTHGDPLVPGVSFSDAPGVAAVLDYKVKFNSPGKYFVWVRAYSTGSEDNGIHVGIDGTWPDSGKKMQWCAGKNAWTWESKQRTNANHCGVAQQIFINVPTAGIHTISFSMREDGFEMDKFILSKAYTKPSGAGANPIAANCDNPNPNPTSIAIPGTIQVENFVAKNGGVKAENTPGGGQNLGFITNNNYTEYNINVANAGIYKMDAFVSSNGVGGNIVASVAGNNLASLTVPVNNDWHNYSTPVSGNLNLAAGTQKIRFTYTGTAGFLFNFDRAVLTLTTPTGSANCSTAPTNLAIASATNTSVTISYNNTANDTRTFELRAFPKGGFSGNINSGGVGFAAGAAGSTSITMNGLQNGTSYDFVLRALCSGGTPGASPLAPTIVGSTTGGTSATTPQTTTLSAIDDAFLQGNTRYNSSILRTESGKRVSYLKFDVSGINGPITAATLKLTVSGDSGNGNIEVNLGNGNNWTEANLNTANAPAKGVLLGNLNKTYSLNQAQNFTLSNLAISGNFLSLVVTQTGGNDVSFASDENANGKPVLTITYDAPASAKIALDTSKTMVYPNPAVNELQVLGIAKHNVISVRDLSGRTVIRENTSTTKNMKLDVSNLQKGVYFLTIKNNSKSTTLRFMKN
ncbi:carbohydrate-binding protein [Aquimarina algiphila]|uniref:carbohydrate-binding protein n=1 Tax=Aquimarina algiphila TaxID=2047982 RepID=UPI002330E5C1|nr:carbohydrate-binding protein [Aquimarina algiphila]